MGYHIEGSFLPQLVRRTPDEVDDNPKKEDVPFKDEAVPFKEEAVPFKEEAVPFKEEESDDGGRFDPCSEKSSTATKGNRGEGRKDGTGPSTRKEHVETVHGVRRPRKFVKFPRGNPEAS